MSIFKSGGQPQQGAFDPRAKFAELQRNPSAVLAEAGFNVPANCRSDQDVLTYLVQSGQVNSVMYNRAARMLGLPLSGNK